MAAKTDKAAGLNKGQAGVPFYTPAQEPAAGTAAQTDSTPSLFRPLRMGPLELHNRLVVSPMCQYSADDGHLTDYHLVHLGQMALQGAGLVFVEATAVEPRGRISPQDAGLWADSQTGPLRRIVDFVHSQNTKIGIQLAHSGRKASTLAPWIGGSANKALAEEQEGGWPGDVVGPSPLPYAADHAMPQELTVDGIRHVVKAFADATERAVKAGVDVVEIHGAHGYLISSFLSPRSNKRTDEYGGSFENRTRLLREIVEALRGVMPKEMPLWVRFSATEWMEWKGEPSWDMESSIRLAKMLAGLGVDVVDVSSGGNSAEQRITGGKTYQTNLARQIRRALRADGIEMLVAAVGSIAEADFARDVVEEGPEQSADLALVGRRFLREPNLVLNMALELGLPTQWPIQYHYVQPKVVTKSG